MYLFDTRTLPEALKQAKKDKMEVFDGQQLFDGWLLYDEKSYLAQMVLRAKSCSRTNKKPARIVVSDGEKRKSYSYRYELGDSENRIEAGLDFAEMCRPQFSWYPCCCLDFPGKDESLISFIGVKDT